MAVRRTYTVPTNLKNYFESDNSPEEVKRHIEVAQKLWNQRVKTLQESLETIAAELEAARAELTCN